MAQTFCTSTSTSRACSKQPSALSGAYCAAAAGEAASAPTRRVLLLPIHQHLANVSGERASAPRSWTRRFGGKGVPLFVCLDIEFLYFFRVERRWSECWEVWEPSDARFEQVAVHCESGE